MLSSNKTNGIKREMTFLEAKELVKDRFGADLTKEGYLLILSVARKEER